MMTLTPHYITDEQGHKISVVLTMEEFEQLLEELEELEDIRLYDEVKNRQEERMDFKEYLRQRPAESHV
ncbi:MAG: hypothetical protein IPH31_08160 [Lewinellaceae bacterium]|nr:hypothetical protein [Lewinellaceae bacterium]